MTYEEVLAKADQLGESSSDVSLRDLESMLQREIRMRKRVYLNRVNDGKMKIEEAVHQIKCAAELLKLVQHLLRFNRGNGQAEMF